MNPFLTGTKYYLIPWYKPNYLGGVKCRSGTTVRIRPRVLHAAPAADVHGTAHEAPRKGLRGLPCENTDVRAHRADSQAGMQDEEC